MSFPLSRSSLANWPVLNLVRSAVFVAAGAAPPPAAAVFCPGWHAAAKSARSAAAKAGFSVMTKRSDSNQMWGGRFSAKPDEVMEAITASIDVDKRLAEEDIAGSKAHAAMLAKTGVISDG